MIRRPPRSTQSRSSAASDVYKRQPIKKTLFGHYRSDNADALLSAGQGLKLDHTFCNGKQGKIFTHIHIRAGLDARSVLADDDIAGNNYFTREFLHAQALSIAITAVTN